MDDGIQEAIKYLQGDYNVLFDYKVKNIFLKKSKKDSNNEFKGYFIEDEEGNSYAVETALSLISQDYKSEEFVYNDGKYKLIYNLFLPENFDENIFERLIKDPAVKYSKIKFIPLDTYFDRYALGDVKKLLQDKEVEIIEEKIIAESDMKKIEQNPNELSDSYRRNVINRKIQAQSNVDNFDDIKSSDLDKEMSESNQYFGYVEIQVMLESLNTSDLINNSKIKFETTYSHKYKLYDNKYTADYSFRAFNDVRKRTQSIFNTQLKNIVSKSFVPYCNPIKKNGDVNHKEGFLIGYKENKVPMKYSKFCSKNYGMHVFGKSRSARKSSLLKIIYRNEFSANPLFRLFTISPNSDYRSFSLLGENYLEIDMSQARINPLKPIYNKSNKKLDYLSNKQLLLDFFVSLGYNRDYLTDFGDFISKFYKDYYDIHSEKLSEPIFDDVEIFFYNNFKFNTSLKADSPELREIEKFVLNFSTGDLKHYNNYQNIDLDLHSKVKVYDFNIQYLNTKAEKLVAYLSIINFYSQITYFYDDFKKYKKELCLEEVHNLLEVLPKEEGSIITKLFSEMSKYNSGITTITQDSIAYGSDNESNKYRSVLTNASTIVIASDNSIDVNDSKLPHLSEEERAYVSLEGHYIMYNSDSNKKHKFNMYTLNEKELILIESNIEKLNKKILNYIREENTRGKIDSNEHFIKFKNMLKIPNVNMYDIVRNDLRNFINKFVGINGSNKKVIDIEKWFLKVKSLEDLSKYFGYIESRTYIESFYENIEDKTFNEDSEKLFLTELRDYFEEYKNKFKSNNFLRIRNEIIIQDNYYEKERLNEYEIDFLVKECGYKETTVHIFTILYHPSIFDISKQVISDYLIRKLNENYSKIKDENEIAIEEGRFSFGLLNPLESKIIIEDIENKKSHIVQVIENSEFARPHSGILYITLENSNELRGLGYLYHISDFISILERGKFKLS